MLPGGVSDQDLFYLDSPIFECLKLSPSVPSSIGNLKVKGLSTHNVVEPSINRYESLFPRSEMVVIFIKAGQ